MNKVCTPTKGPLWIFLGILTADWISSSLHRSRQNSKERQKCKDGTATARSSSVQEPCWWPSCPGYRTGTRAEACWLKCVQALQWRCGSMIVMSSYAFPSQNWLCSAQFCMSSICSCSVTAQGFNYECSCKDEELLRFRLHHGDGRQTLPSFMIQSRC